MLSIIIYLFYLFIFTLFHPLAKLLFKGELMYDEILITIRIHKNETANFEITR